MRDRQLVGPLCSHRRTFLSVAQTACPSDKPGDDKEWGGGEEEEEEDGCNTLSSVSSVSQSVTCLPVTSSPATAATLMLDKERRRRRLMYVNAELEKVRFCSLVATAAGKSNERRTHQTDADAPCFSPPRPLRRRRRPVPRAFQHEPPKATRPFAPICTNAIGPSRQRYIYTNIQ